MIDDPGGAVLLAARPRLTLLAPFAIALFFVLMPLPVRDRLASATNPRDVTMNDRVAMWKAGRAMIADHPLTGVGPGRVKPLYAQYRVPGWVNPIPGHLHNNLVMTAAETGIPSLLAYLAFVGNLGLVTLVLSPFREVTRGGLAVADGKRRVRVEASDEGIVTLDQRAAIYAARGLGWIFFRARNEADRSCRKEQSGRAGSFDKS